MEIDMENNNEQNLLQTELGNMIDQDDIEIRFVFPQGLKNTVAIVEIKIKPLVFRGFRLMVSDYVNRRGEHINLVPPTFPSKKHPGNTYKVIYIEDLELWRRLEDKVIEKYHEFERQKYKNQQ